MTCLTSLSEWFVQLRKPLVCKKGKCNILNPKGLEPHCKGAYANNHSTASVQGPPSGTREIGGSCTAEVEFEFTTWVWVQATAETAFGRGLVVRSPGSVKAGDHTTHNSLGHCQNVHSAVAGHSRMNISAVAFGKKTAKRWYFPQFSSNKSIPTTKYIVLSLH